MWGYEWIVDENGGQSIQRILTGGAAVDVPGSIRNVVPDGAGGLVVSFDYGGNTRVLRNGAWNESPLLAPAIDVNDGGTAIGSSHGGLAAPILLNGKWTDIERAVPMAPDSFDPPSPWHDPAVSLLDTTAGGWILARRDEFSSEHAVMVPLRLEGFYTKSDGSSATFAVGVDDFSIGSSAPGDEVADRIWIMAPQGGFQKIVKVKAPLTEGTPLTLLASNITFPAAHERTISSDVNAVALRASDAVQSGGERLMSVLLGNAEAGEPSLSKPVGLKIMKGRTVNVTVYMVTKLYGTTAEAPVDVIMMPTQDEIEDHLNDMFRPQINTVFHVTLEDAPLEVRWDAAPENGSFDVQIPTTETPGEEGAILAVVPANPLASDIRVFIMGNPGGPLGKGADAYGLTDRDNAICWVHGTHWGKNKTKGFLLDTIAHEIGHVLVGRGHPDQEVFPGPAPLPGTRHTCRLMCSGPNSGSQSRLLVKREWDEAEIWLEANIKEPQQ
ncbi:MAG: hypothetical protein KDN05_15880 [Verrucomicrobiae bacterium]|nr:hypothetical protein [Verrucomicrobiae bacterium]